MGGATDDRTRTIYTRPEGKREVLQTTHATYTRPEGKVGGATDDMRHLHAIRG